METKQIIDALYEIADLADTLPHDNGIARKARELIDDIWGEEKPVAEPTTEAVAEELSA